MAPKLYGDARSPCVRAVLLTVKALNIDVEYVKMDLGKKEHLTDEYLKLNPRHTVPTLEDNGFVVWDSHAIMIYLASKYGKNNPIYPDDEQKRAVINQMLFFETGDIFSAHRHISYPIIYKGVKQTPVICTEELEKGYKYLDELLALSKFVAGDEMTIADFSIWTTLYNSQIWIPLDAGKYPNLGRWCAILNKLPYKNLNMEGSEEFMSFMKDFLKKQ
ncbi:unnamed protein product [Phyllotreta striolata]|uniref:Glutathione S-transferase n=1 Tax=Phyllotreta striolata TaxID=444603 RepID=A0A9N9TLR6_PHYSR|nr:unnamed protein product [Phyllotreta striolata]